MTDSADPGTPKQEPTKKTPLVSRATKAILAVLVLVWLASLIFMNDLYEVVGAAMQEPPVERKVVLDPNLTADQQIMYTILQVGGPDAINAVKTIVDTDDKRFIPVLVEMFYANEHSPVVVGAGAHKHHFALASLTGAKMSPNQADEEMMSDAWFAWCSTTDYQPPPGFATWKGNLLSRIDPMFGELIRDDLPSRIRVEEILSGGVKFGGIPALDNPKMIPAAEATYLTPEEPVFGISINGDSRAYPQRILDWHEMANDVIGGVPVTLAYCTLCGSGIAYDTRGSDGQTYTFGSSGLLYRNNKLMFDNETVTLWNHLTGRPVLGKLAATDVKLKLLPVVVSSWQNWKNDHPDTTVLDLNTGFRRRYKPGAAYGSYFSSNETMFPMGEHDDRLALKSLVYGLRLDGKARAYPVNSLTQEKIVNDVVGNSPVVLVSTLGSTVVKGRARSLGGAGTVLMGTHRVEYDAGADIRVFDRGERTFEQGPNYHTLVDDRGEEWKVTETALIGPHGQLAPRINGVQSFWFAWQAFNADTEVYEQ